MGRPVEVVAAVACQASRYALRYLSRWMFHCARALPDWCCQRGRRAHLPGLVDVRRLLVRIAEEADEGVRGLPGRCPSSEPSREGSRTSPLWAEMACQSCFACYAKI
jgi:hypothetical protein